MKAITPAMYHDLVDVASKPGFQEWLAGVRATGGCAAPIHLWGNAKMVNCLTGEVLSERAPGRLMVACRNRRRSRCPACSETYRADTFQLIKAGIVGGKSVPESVKDHPRLFATFTAPSFGPVHHRPTDDRGRPRLCHPRGTPRCGQFHDQADPLLGQPLDPTTYDYRHAVIWNALSTKLWARTVELANRKAASMLGYRVREWPEHGRVSVAKVAEYQERLSVHFHAIFRLDGPEPDAPLPADATPELLIQVIRYAADRAAVELPDCGLLSGVPTIVWGDQLDLRAVVPQEGDGKLNDGQVAGYLAKYAAKGSENAGTIDRPIACRECSGLGHVEGRACFHCHGSGQRQPIDALQITAHARAMIETAWMLGGQLELLHLRLRPWAHMLGFRGHFATKSRRYSTTLALLRGARQEWRVAQIRPHRANRFDAINRDLEDFGLHVESPEQSDDDAVLVIGQWNYVGRGHSPGEAIYAATIAQDRIEARRTRREVGDSDAY
jgi:hypothetical protein